MIRRPVCRAAALSSIVLLAANAGRAQQGTTAEKIFAAIGVREGMTVCEIGAGDGEMSIAAAKLVGEGGRVYTSELGEQRVKKLQQRVTDGRAAQVTVVAGGATQTNFPEAGCDALFMHDVYHHFTEPAAMNASIAASLKPGARAAIVDFTPPPGSHAPTPADRSKDGMHGIGPETLRRELKDAGFEEVSAEVDNRWFMVVVAKPKGT